MFNVLKECRKFFGPWVTAAPPRPKPRRTLLGVEWLERRDCPSTTWTPAPLQGGGFSDNGNDVNNYNNGLPSATNPLVLDGSQTATNQAITFSSSLTVGSITVTGGYNNTLTIKKLANLFTSANDTINNGCTLKIVSYDANGIALMNGNSFNVLSGGTLILTDPGGTKSGSGYLYTPQPAGTVGDFLNNQGTVTWIGSVPSGNPPPPPITDTIRVPVLNNGTFNVNGGGQGGTPGILKVSGLDAVNTNNDSFFQNASTASTHLTNGGTLIAVSGYEQIEGVLSQDDNSGCSVGSGSTGKNGDIDINGGSVTVDSNPNNTGTLSFNASTVEINGIINVSGMKTGGASKQSDLLNCGTATVTFQANSLLNVGTKGNQALGNGNRWAVMSYGIENGVWGQQPILPAGMAVSTGATNVLVTN